MKRALQFTMLCTALLAVMCAPALAQTYSIQCEDIYPMLGVAGQPWEQRPNQGPTDSLVPRFVDSDPYAYGGSGLKINDNRGGVGTTDADKLFIKNTSTFPFNQTVTAVVRVKCTPDVPFNAATTSPSSSGPWSRTFVVVAKPATGTGKLGVGLAIRPDFAGVINNNTTTLYGQLIPGDNTHWVTWTIVVMNGGTSFRVYRNGKLVSTGTNGSGIESPLGGQFDGVYLSAAPNVTVGSWMYDYCGYTAGDDPTWRPITPTQQISGVITDATSPTTRIANATVSLSNGAQVTADPAGVYTFTAVEPEEYTVTVSADGYFAKSVKVALPQSVPSAVRNVSLVPIPAATETVVDTFNRGELGSTESPVYPWIDTGEAGNAMIDWNAQLFMMPLFAHGISIGGTFLPANIDYTIDLGPITTDSDTGFWGGIGYRQAIPCNYDTQGGQAAADSGYLVWCPAGGAGVYLWRLGTIAYTPLTIDWSVAHKLRVVAYGNVHQVYLDGAKVIEAADSGKLTGGYCGIFRDRATIWADNVNIKHLPDAAGLGTISGNVYDAANPATKVANAYVQCSDGRQILTDASGNYSVSTNSTDEQSITVKAPGYQDKTISFEPLLGTTTINFAMDADPGYRETIAAAKAAGADVPVSLINKVITAQWSGTVMYVSEPDRSAAIKVTVPQDTLLYQKTGKYVWLTGTMRQDAATGEFYIAATSKFEPPVAPNYLKALAMNGRAVLGAEGLSSIGLDAKVVGKVTAVNSPTDFTINDGSGDLKIVINPAVGLNPWPVVNDYVEAEGIVSLDGTTPETAVRCLKLWNSNANHLNASYAGFERPNPLEGWGWNDNGGGGTTLTWDTTNPHSGVNCAQFTNTHGFQPGFYGELYCIPGGQWLGAEYELSCWVRGTGVMGATQPAHVTDWGSFSFNLPIGDFDWQQVRTSFRFAGSHSGQYPNNLYFHVNITEACTALAVDDFKLRFSRGNFTVIQPAPAP